MKHNGLYALRRMSEEETCMAEVNRKFMEQLVRKEQEETARLLDEALSLNVDEEVRGGGRGGRGVLGGTAEARGVPSSA